MSDDTPTEARPASGEHNANTAPAEAAGVAEEGEPLVRARVALELAHVQVKEAIPVLIDLLDQLPPGPAWHCTSRV